MYKEYQEKRTEKVGLRTWEQSRDVPATTEFPRRSEKKMSRKIPRRKKVIYRLYQHNEVIFLSRLYSLQKCRSPR